MDFKKLIDKLDNIDAATVVPAEVEQARKVVLSEDAQLRVLAGTSTVVQEAKVAEKAADDADKAKKSKADSNSKAMPKKKGKTEAINDELPTVVEASEAQKAAREKFKAKVAEKKKPAKKDEKVDEAAKPDFLDVDKDGDKKEPMKKALKDKKKKSSVKEADETDYDKPTYMRRQPKKPKKDAPDWVGKDTDIPAYKRKADSAKKKSPVKESRDYSLSFVEMAKLVRESGGQQQLDPVDQELFAWASRVAQTKLGEGLKADMFAGMVYERMGGRFEMYDVLSEDQSAENTQQVREEDSDQ